MKYIYLLLTIILIGCTTPVYEPPTITYPSQQKSVVKEVNQVEETLKIIEFDNFIILQPVPRLHDVMLNCGSAAQGIITSRIMDDYNVKTLYVNNTYRDYIGGCPDVLRDHPEIEEVHIYAEQVATDEYNELIKWTPSRKLFIEPDEVFTFETFK